VHEFFTAYYGLVWTSAVPVADVQLKAFAALWSDALKNFTPEQIKQALAKINAGETEFSKYPPRPGEFAAICKTCVKHLYDHYETAKALPRPAVNKSLVEAKLAEMRAALRGVR
jgi:hypothetical protein